jgi:DNA-binding MarR family transcriptional regulator
MLISVKSKQHERGELDSSRAALTNTTSIVELLTAIQRTLFRELGVAFEEESITVDQWRILRALAKQPDDPMVVVAAKLGIAQPTFTRAIDTLVDSAYLYRTHSPNDRRRITVQLSPLGDALLSRLNSMAAKHERSVALRHGGSRLDDLHRALRQFANAESA